ncbi:type II secretion system protein GspM [Paraburkholderia phosphatilytica]|uniref:type II secretion system protein GspM n=1 Tax=Paraburkholderia phosphatilytica TaxID=2282883 RepID=UPI000E501001|nr:type II secretion system protein M [Paraburkholderia phosphatilytica]
MKTALGETWGVFWGARNEREKALLTWGGAAVAVVVAWSVLWAPAQQGRATLRAELPALQKQLAQMTAEANEARTLSASVQGVAPTGGALRDALTASLNDHGLTPTQVQVIGNAIQITLKNASFPEWTVWLNDARRQLKVQVVEVHATALKADGQVDLTASLQPSTATR